MAAVAFKPRQPASGAVRQCRFRRRQANGLAVLSVDVPYDALCAALLDSKRLSADDALDRDRVEAAVGEVLRDFIARWRAADPA